MRSDRAKLVVRCIDGGVSFDEAVEVTICSRDSTESAWPFCLGLVSPCSIVDAASKTHVLLEFFTQVSKSANGIGFGIYSMAMTIVFAR
jgi:hypothetical protein